MSDMAGVSENKSVNSDMDKVEIREERQLKEDQVAMDRETVTRGLPFDRCLHINNIEAHTVNIAPGEGQSPMPIFTDQVFEEGCNPDKYPFGRGGYSTERTVKITANKYFNQRLLDGIDGRFAKDTQYLHIAQYAQYAVESKNISDQINSITKSQREAGSRKGCNSWSAQEQ